MGNGRDSRRRVGPWRGFGWIFAALWWSTKSASGPQALIVAAIPWTMCSLFAKSTAGLSLAICLAAYASMSLWSARCAMAHFLSRDGMDIERDESAPTSAKRGLIVLFAICSVASLMWAHLWAQASGIGEMLKELSEAGSGGTSAQIWGAYWEKSGLDGIAWGIAAVQGAVALANAWWCLLPFAAISRPGSSIADLARFGARSCMSAPWAMATLGASGAFLAQASIALPPLALLSGLWFSACAFAFREMEHLLDRHPPA